MFAQTDQNHCHSHFHHNHQSSHEYLIFYQSENSCETHQIMAPPILWTVEPRIIVIFGKHGVAVPTSAREGFGHSRSRS